MFPHLSLYISRLPPREGSILTWAFHLRRFVMKNTARIECQDVLLETILVPYVYAYVARGHKLTTTFQYVKDGHIYSQVCTCCNSRNVSWKFGCPLWSLVWIFAIHFLTSQTHLDIRISPSFNSGIVLQVFPLRGPFCVCWVFGGKS